MTKGEETTLIKIDKQLALLNNNFDNHIKEDVDHRKYIKNKLCAIEDRMKDGDTKFNKLDIAVNGTEVEKYEDGLVAKGNIHNEYHEENEEKWGSQLYFRNHLKQFAGVIIVILFLLGLIGINIDSIAQATLKSFGVKIDLPAKE